VGREQQGSNAHANPQSFARRCSSRQLQQRRLPDNNLNLIISAQPNNTKTATVESTERSTRQDRLENLRRKSLGASGITALLNNAKPNHPIVVD